MENRIRHEFSDDFCEELHQCPLNLAVQLLVRAGNIDWSSHDLVSQLGVLAGENEILESEWKIDYSLRLSFPLEFSSIRPKRVFSWRVVCLISEDSKKSLISLIPKNPFR